MTKSPFPTKVRNQHGYTLLELMIAAAIGALVFYTLMSLLGQTTNFATHFHGTAGAIEASSDAISQLNGMMPEIVRIRRCSCSGSSTTATASCRWFPPASSAEPNIGKDPVQNYGVASPGTEVEIFAGDFESFGGAVTATGYPGLRGLFTGYLGQGGNASSGIKCAGMDGVLSGLYAKGCKMPISLYYTSPTLESGTTPAKPGSLRIAVGGDGSAFSGGTSDTWIGRPTDTGYRGIVGVTQLSCGFAQSSASSASMLFVLNLKIKSRSTTEQNVNSSSYESWWPPLTSSNGGLSGKNYTRGTLRDLRFKYAFRNLAGRGMYQWRVQSNRDCAVNGETVSDKSDCCSLAAVASAPYKCIACKAAGVSAGSAQECCSEQIGGTACK